MVTNLDILAAESGGLAGLNTEWRHLRVRCVVGWNDGDSQEMYW